MNKDYRFELPLFIYGNDPIMVYIIANELIVLEKFGELRNQSSLALHFLDTIAKNSITKNIIPPQLTKYLEHHPQSQPCICGMYEFESFVNRCLALKMSIQENETLEKIVHLSDFALLESNATLKVYVNKIDLEVSLTGYEAFILFANIIFEAMGNILYCNDYLLTMPFDKKQFKEVFNQHSFFNKSGYAYQIELFCLEYFEYLLNQLELKTIYPEMILRLSGSKVITRLASFDSRVRTYVYEKLTMLTDSTDSLPMIEQICYSVMFLHSRNLTYLPEFSRLYNMHENKIKKLLEYYIKEYPERYSGEIENREYFFKKMLGKDYQYGPY